MDEQIERAMDEIVPRTEAEAEEEADATNDGGEATEKLLYLRDLRVAGWQAIADMNPRRVRADTAARTARKKKLDAYIIAQVQELKEESAQRPIAEEMEDPEEAPWTTYLHSLCPQYYS